MGQPLKPGDWVRLRDLPSWVNDLPAESQVVFRSCVGRLFRIEEIDDDHGVLVLDVSAVVDARFSGVHNDIRVEAEWVERV